MKRTRLFGAVLAGFTLVISSLGSATALGFDDQSGRNDARPDRFPSTFSLPDGFQPEGIAIGPGPVAYFGSLADGSIYRASLLTGKGEVLSEGPGTPSVGMKTDNFGRLFVSGGAGGDARVINTRTGDVLASYQLTEGESFVNDVVLTHDAAWFTDSANPVLYKIPLGPAGTLPSADEVETIELSGDMPHDPEAFNGNGIASTPDRRGLIVMHSGAGALFRVDPVTGETTAVDLGGESVPNGDGLLLKGETLYVVQNRSNLVAVLELNRDATEGTLQERIADPRFDVPTTVAAFGNRLYLPNARFGTPPEPTTPYSVVAIPRF